MTTTTASTTASTTAPTAASTTAVGPTVTLQPPSPSGGIPGDATDPADFYGIFIAIAVIALAVVAVRLIFRHR